MKKIGITTFHNAHNYGAMLQAFALSEKLSKNYNVELIDYYNPKIYNNYKVIRPLCKNPFRFVKRFSDDIVNFTKKQKRYNNFDSFIKNNCKLSKRVYSKDELSLIDYDILITGSDQVWNPNIVGELSDIFTLNFGSEKTKRISYAASVGNSNSIIKLSDQFKKKLSIIDNISVREYDAKLELEKILDKSVDTVLDPTLLLTAEEWDKKLSCIEEKEEYLLAYVVQPDDEYIKIVNELSERENLKVLHFGIKNPGYNNVLKSVYTAGPLEFLSYIKSAKYVITTSFHATVFSIIFNKEFFVVPHRSTGSRVTNLLSKFGIDGRFAYSLKEFVNKDYKAQIDWEKVNERLMTERTASLEWLNTVIER